MGATRLRKGKFDLRIKFENEKIIDGHYNDFKSLENIFNKIKKKFK